MSDHPPQNDGAEERFDTAATRWAETFDAVVEQLRNRAIGESEKDKLATARCQAIEYHDPPGLVRWVESRNQVLDALIDDVQADDTLSIDLTLAVIEEVRWLRFLMARSGLGRADAALMDVSRAAVTVADLCPELLEDAHSPIQAELHRIQTTVLDIRLRQLDAEGRVRRGPALVELLAATEIVVEQINELVEADKTSAIVLELKNRAQELFDWLERRVDEEIRQEEPDRSAEMARLMANYGLERVDEALMVAADAPPAAALGVLERAYKRSEDIVSKWSSQPGDQRQLPAELKKLRSAQKKLANEAQECGLQSRLERIFGLRVVSFVERLILALILFVIALLVVEAVADLTDETRLVLLWIDTGICGVFLVEFFTKLALTPGNRMRWFWRHFLVDFLPSIPFGLLAHSLSQLDVLRVGRAGRLARLGRLTRYVRLLSPVIRVFRVLAFILRGLDRVVHRHRHLFNHNVMLFAPQTEAASPSSELPIELLASSQKKAQRLLVQRLDQLPADQLAGAIASSMTSTGQFLLRLSSCAIVQVFEPPMPPSQTREIRIEELLEQLLGADENTIRRRLGVDMITRLARKLRRLDIPILRAMPLVRKFAPGARRMPDSGLLAKAAHSVGRSIRGMYDRMLTVGDLSGVVSGPQLLDRVGSTLSRATGTPARRLLILGGGFLLLSGIVRLTGFETLGHIMKLMSRYMGTPLLVLGGSALALYLIGIWLQRIAGEATSVLERTAEAQYLNLLKLVKNDKIEDGLCFLHQRTLEPELRVACDDNAPDRPETPTRELQARLTDWRPAFEPTEDLATRHQRRVLGLFRDYLDGAILHRSDHKTTEQLLGNLALRNLCERRLSFSRAQRKNIRRLDMSTHGGSSETFFWFHSITRTISQRTAELLIEYNRHAIPLSDQAGLTDEEKANFATWIENRKAGKPFRDFHAELSYWSTAFTALHFLSPGREIEASVRAEFGDDVLTALRYDRRRMIREVFGSYPLHLLPRERRVVNPYLLYRRYVAGLRLVLLPFVIAKAYFRATWFFLRRFWQIVAEVRRPELVKLNLRQTKAGFGVAVRKIGRMRHQVFLESSWIRARADVEYLGLGFAFSKNRHDCDTFDDDLNALGASVFGQRERFEQLRRERRRDLKLLKKALESKGVTNEDVGALVADNERLRSKTAQRVLRAVTMAFAADDRQCRSLLTAVPRLETEFVSLLEDPAQLPHRNLLFRMFDGVRRIIGLIIPSVDPLPRALTRYLASREQVLDGPQRRVLLRAIRANFDGLAPLLRLAGSEQFLDRTTDAGFERLRQISAEVDRLEEELVTIRTVQSLALLDIRYYRNLICELGEYSAEEGAATLVIEGGKMVNLSAERALFNSVEDRQSGGHVPPL